jgi:hypothetical protein
VARKAFDPEYVASMGDGTAPANEPTLRINPRLLRYRSVSNEP